MDKTQPKSSLLVEDLPVLAADDTAVDESMAVTAAPLRSQFGSESWGDTISHRIKKLNRTRIILTQTLFGMVVFFLFLYLTFPLNVVKEVIVTKVNTALSEKNVPVRVNVGSLKVRFPLGVSLEDLQVSNINNAAAVVKIGKLDATVKFLPVFIGRLSADFRVTQSGGSVGLLYHDSIIDLVKMTQKNVRIPSGNVKITFSNFEILQYTTSLLELLKPEGSSVGGRGGSSANMSEFASQLLSSTLAVAIQPFLESEVGGQISGAIQLNLPAPGESFNLAKGDLDLKIGKAYFEMKDETFAIPRQDFNEARIKAKLEKKTITIPNETKLLASDVGIELSGSMNVSESLSVNDVKLALSMLMKGKIEENFKTLLLVMIGCDPQKMVNGKMDVELTGNFSALSCR
ncbi:MAG: hypothetical protein RLZZ488_953 [Pseudomonadota bacterium]|jgi:hypothetical protein